MIDELLTNPDKLAQGLLSLFVVAFFLYLIVYSLLEVRQVRIIQEKIITPGDKIILYIAYFYLGIQILVFVIALLFL